MKDLGPVHRFILEWLKLWAYGHRAARRRKELVGAVRHQVEKGVEGFRWLVDARDLDREVRKMCRECLELGYPVLSWGCGYFYGNPRDPHDRAIFERQITARVFALLKVRRLVRWAMEAEARRLAGERRIQQPALPPPAVWSMKTAETFGSPAVVQP